MAAETVFALTFGAFGVASLLALAGDGLGRGTGASRLSALLLVAGGGVSLYASWTVPPTVTYGSFISGAAFSGVAGLVGVLGGVCALSTASTESEGASIAQQTALVCLASVGAGVAAQATDVVTLLIALEIAAASGYALVAATRTRASSEAAMKYLVQGAVVTALIALAAAVLVGAYASSGSYPDIVGSIEQGPRLPLLFAMTLLLAGLVFKTGGAPFHSWAPDAYETAPRPVAAFLAGPVKLAMITSLATVAVVIGSAGATQARPMGLLGSQLFPVVAGIAVLSVLVGSLLAWRQKSYTRMLAYAGVAQVGYALIAVAAGNHSAAVFFACTYAIASTGTFVAAHAFSIENPDWDGSTRQLAGAARRRPLLGLALSVLVLSLAGIPPLLGFWGKLQAFRAAVVLAVGFRQPATINLAVLFGVLALVGILGSVISVGYYGSVVRVIYSRPTDEPGRESGQASVSEGVVILLALAVLVLGLAPLVMPFSSALRGFLL